MQSEDQRKGTVVPGMGIQKTQKARLPNGSDKQAFQGTTKRTEG